MQRRSIQGSTLALHSKWTFFYCVQYLKTIPFLGVMIYMEVSLSLYSTFAYRGSSHRRKNAACHKCDILLAISLVFYSFKLFLVWPLFGLQDLFYYLQYTTIFVFWRTFTFTLLKSVKIYCYNFLKLVFNGNTTVIHNTVVPHIDFEPDLF